MRKVIKHPITGGVAATSTMTVSCADMLHWIPKDIGKLGVLVGIALSCVLIVVNIRKSYIDGKLAEAQLRRERREIEDRRTPKK